MTETEIDALRERKFHRFVLVASGIICVLFVIVFALASNNYRACGSLGRCPTGWDIQL